ncbi:DNA polymerase III subunit delta [Belliella kenyensis]|uniref:DNA polymerase III subunit delta n=1 Tax=Belliella kenyensis TaxID=1472724 RepID=A0ABV8ENC6_9BACT|nr:DNA polymerase III subunit delta [Belliella kenyensis]MCH7403766.1 DNA polymerase III subunit delta [Belliella kenyensis]MDN3604430.1 DNA polymerase III subunit delta [Belliella kenyensis]
MPSKPEDIIKDLHAGKYAPVYFLQGEEPYFIDVITDYIEKNAIPEHEKGFNQTVMYGKDASMPAIMSNARRFPMMADRQVVIVKEAQNINGLGKDDVDGLLINYLKNPLPSTILVFAHKYKVLDGRKALAKELDKKAILVKSEKVPDYKMAAWVKDYIHSKGHQIDDRNASIIAESIGNNLEVLTNEIGKMLINFTSSTQIDATHIQQYIGINKDYNNFELTKAIGVKDVIKANKIIHYFGQNPKGHPLIPMIALMFNYFQKIALAHEMSKASDQELARSLGVNPFFVKEYRIAARNYNLGKVIESFTYLREADLRSKGVNANGMDESQILKELIFKIMH